jgi:tetratricopeptide (TPR) repeat protein
MASSKQPANSGHETSRNEAGSALTSTEPSTVHALPSGAVKDRAIFQRDGDYWTLGYGQKTVRLRHIKGLSYLRYLLINPGTDIHALELARIATPAGEIAEPDSPTSRSTAAELMATGTHLGYLGNAGELLDSEAKKAYQRRLVELREQQEQARELGQVERAEKAEEEIDVLLAELTRATGLKRRSRVAASSSERARQSVTRAIRDALSRITNHHPELATTLERHVKTGTYCCYAPDPNATIFWETGTRGDDPTPLSTRQSAIERRNDQQEYGDSANRLLYGAQTEFVGRQHETQLLHGLIEQALGGSVALALIGGGPGVGKTRLAGEIAHQATVKGFRCFVGRCQESGEPSPYLPFAEILELMLASSQNAKHFRDEIGDVGGELAQIAPSLRRAFPDLPSRPDLPEAQLPRFIFQGFAEFLCRASRRSPLFLVLDDLHWADEATLNLLNFLSKLTEQAPLFLLATYRDADLGSNPALMSTLEELIHMGLRPLRLEGLSQAEVAQMIRSLSMREPPLALVQLAFDETQGNPFFVEEIYKHLIEEGKLFDDDGEFRDGLTLDENDIPEHVRLVLRRRLRRLDEAARQVLAAAAVIGRSFTFEMLQAITQSVDADPLLTTIERAQHMGLLVGSDGPEFKLNFAHELVRQTLLSDISTPRRQRLHLAAAAAIEELEPQTLNEQSALVAFHLRMAGRLADPVKTAKYFWTAGTVALEAAAYEDAYRNFENAASYKEIDLRLRAECLQGLVQANRGRGKWQEALRNGYQALDISRELGDDEMTANATAEVFRILFVNFQYGAAAEMGERALAELKDEPSAGRGNIMVALGMVYIVTNNYARAYGVLSEALSLAQRLSNPRLLAAVKTNRSVLNAVYVEIADCLSNSREALELTGFNSPSIRGVALQMYMTALYWSGRIEEANRIRRELEHLARKFGQAGFLVPPSYIGAWTEFENNPDLTVLEEQFRQIVERCRSNVPHYTGQSLAQLSLTKFLGGNLPSALDYAREACSIKVPDYLGGFVVGMTFRPLAYTADRQRAMELLNGILLESKLPHEDRPNTFGSWACLVSVVEGLAMLGECEQTAKFYPLLCRLLDTGMVIFPWIERFPQTIAGVAAAAGRQWQQAEEHFRTALKQAADLSYRLEQAECRRFYASMLIDRGAPGDCEQARDLLKEAVETYSRIGMPLHREIGGRLLARVQ